MVNKVKKAKRKVKEKEEVKPDPSPLVALELGFMKVAEIPIENHDRDVITLEQEYPKQRIGGEGGGKKKKPATVIKVKIVAKAGRFIILPLKGDMKIRMRGKKGIVFIVPAPEEHKPRSKPKSSIKSKSKPRLKHKAKTRNSSKRRVHEK